MKLERFMVNEDIKKAEIMASEPWNNLSGPQKKAFWKFWTSAKKDCQPFLREIRKQSGARNLMYRNMPSESVSGDMGTKKPRRNRQPRDTGSVTHNYFDLVLDDLFGWKGRSEGVFCSGEPNWGGAYGDSYVLFPKGKYQFIWSKDVLDSYSIIGKHSLVRRIQQMHEKEIEKSWEVEYGEGQNGYWSSLDQTVYSVNTTQKTEDKGAKNKEEALKIMLTNATKNKDYDKKQLDAVEYGIKSNIEWYGSLNKFAYVDDFRDRVQSGEDITEREMEWVKDAIEVGVVNKLDYRDKDMNKALDSKHEIMLNTYEYYYIKTHPFAEVIETILWGPE